MNERPTMSDSRDGYDSGGDTDDCYTSEFKERAFRRDWAVHIETITSAVVRGCWDRLSDGDGDGRVALGLWVVTGDMVRVVISVIKPDKCSSILPMSRAIARCEDAFWQAGVLPSRAHCLFEMSWADVKEGIRNDVVDVIVGMVHTGTGGSHHVVPIGRKLTTLLFWFEIHDFDERHPSVALCARLPLGYSTYKYAWWEQKFQVRAHEMGYASALGAPLPLPDLRRAIQCRD